MRYSRYAIYYTFPDGPLARFGTAWLGWDAARGVAVAPPALNLPGPDIAALTETPRRYGLHATIKPPFRLAGGCTARGLAEAVAELCAGLPAAPLGRLRLTRMGRFLALVPEAAPPALSELAARVVRDLDPFRAPMTREERDRRAARGLGADRLQLLDAWGSAHVMEAFRFHVTLTGRLSDADLARVESALAEALSPLLDAPIMLDRLTLTGEAEDGFFHHIGEFALSGRAPPLPA